VNQFIAGTIATGLIGLSSVAIERKLKKAPKLHELTKATEVSLDFMSEQEEAMPVKIAIPNLPIRDVLAIYLNSRANRNRVNERRVDNRNPDCIYLLSRVDEDHEKIKRAALACVISRVTVRLVPDCPSSYPRVLLWTYANEQEVLSQVSQFCSPPNQQFISSRV
jgi:hypothetical protein